MNVDRRSSRRRRSGFTLIEVLLVLVILVILGAIAAPLYISTQQQANIKAAKAQALNLKSPLNVYRLNTGDFPTSLDALWQCPADLPDPNKWGGPYLEEQLPLDPWGNQYQYQYPGTHNPGTYDVWSMGPDRADGTADDVGNWD
jgi:general secretion pathway protein G